MKKVLLCFMAFCTLSVSSAVMQSCCGEDAMCKSITTISMKGLDNSGREPVDLIDNQVTAAALVLKLDLDISISTCHTPNNISLMSSAYANKCEPIDKPDPVAFFELYADKRFDAQHDSGQSLNDLFKINDTSEFYNTYDEKHAVQFYLLKSPDDTGTFVFSAKVMLESGRQFDVVSEPIKLLK